MGRTAVSAVLIAAVLVVSGCSDSDDDPLKDGIPSNGQQAPEESAPADPEATEDAEEEGEKDDDTPTDPEEGISVGESFVEAYNEQSYSDDSPNPWIDAVEPYMTDKGYKELTSDIDPEDGGIEVKQWEDHKVNQRAVVTSSDWIPGHDHSPTTMSIYVVFDLKAESDGHPYEVQDTMYLDLERVDDEWKVSAINNSDEILKAVGGSDDH